MCTNDYMSVAQARCPDCKQVLEIPYDWCDQEITQPEIVADMLAQHARRMPLLHPTLLTDHHLTVARRLA